MCVCHFWGYYSIHVQIFKCQFLCFKPPDISACHYFCLSAFLVVCLCLFPFWYLSVSICESLLYYYQFLPQAAKLMSRLCRIFFFSVFCIASGVINMDKCIWPCARFANTCRFRFPRDRRSAGSGYCLFRGWDQSACASINSWLKWAFFKSLDFTFLDSTY